MEFVPINLEFWKLFTNFLHKVVLTLKKDVKNFKQWEIFKKCARNSAVDFLYWFVQRVQGLKSTKTLKCTPEENIYYLPFIKLLY